MNSTLRCSYKFISGTLLPARLPLKYSISEVARMSTSLSPGGFVYTTQKGDMLKYQHTLPKLPVPPLNQTLQRYLISVKPLMSNKEFQKTKDAVEEFGRENGVGQKLHEMLLEKAKHSDKWLSEWWLNVAYLSYRLPVLIHSNPATACPRLAIRDKEEYLEKATVVMISLALYKIFINTQILPIDYAQGAPLCMSQYQKFYGCRIPGEKVDTLRKMPSNELLYAIVAHNGHFVKLQVLYPCTDGTLQIAPFDYIKSQLSAILSHLTVPSPSPVGLLTGAHRDKWYQARERLLKDPLNAQSLHDIETAMFMVSLDMPHPQMDSLKPDDPYTDAHATILTNRALHGNGSDFNTSNRWFDMASQYFISPDGGLGSNLEHSVSDGSTAINNSNFVFDNCLKKDHRLRELPCAIQTGQLIPYKPLKWNITPETANDIKQAKEEVDKLINNLDLQVLTFDKYGKNFIKSMKLSPDAFLQQAIQLAYYRRHGSAAAVYESASTRKFKYGRTETIRSQNPDSLAFFQVMDDQNISKQDKLKAFKQAIRYHVWYTREAVNAQGVDRHLLGMKLLADENGIELPSLYTDPAYTRSLTHGLSTSQVPVPFDVVLSFGPTAESGYGVCYNPREEKIIFSISSFNSFPDTNSLALGHKIIQALKDIKELLETTVISKL